MSLSKERNHILLYHSIYILLWLSLKEMDTAMRVQILDEADCISHGINTLKKDMNPIILPLAMGK